VLYEINSKGFIIIWNQWKLRNPGPSPQHLFTA